MIPAPRNIRLATPLVPPAGIAQGAPPSDAEAFQAAAYFHDVSSRGVAGEATAAEVTAASDYSFSVAKARHDAVHAATIPPAAPQWVHQLVAGIQLSNTNLINANFAPVTAAIANLTTLVNNNNTTLTNNITALTNTVNNNNTTLTNNITALTNSVDNLAASVLKNEIVGVKTYNGTCNDGISRQYMVLPNRHGIDPTEAPNSLPMLSNINIINRLDSQTLNLYLAFYQLHQPQALVERKRSLGAQLGLFNVSYI
ncbi:hypothetical protein BDR26DRAFT_93112 [Obelidium mucronatum]|nr:hypothetical protein BDR26DRAFT_93112 [Obelidium mucronatum]